MPLCSFPWQGLDISPQGEFKPCCKYSRTVAFSLEEYQNSEELAALKKAMTLGIQVPECYKCWDDEASGIPSKRQIDYANHLSVYPVTDTYRIVSASFGNTCNLACRYCNSYSSSKWGDSEKQLLLNIPAIPIRAHNKYYKNDTFMANIADLSRNAALVEFSGGEPFAAGVSEHKRFLRRLILGNPESMSLHYITNVTIFPDDEFWELWQHFKNVDIQLSLDGIEARFEYLRWPAKWSDVFSNVQSYQKYQSDRNNIQISISHTVGSLNVYYLDEFVNWCVDNNLPSPYLGLVYTPIQYNIQNLPAWVKSILLERLGDKFLPIKQHLRQTGVDQFVDLLTWTRELDRLRKQQYSTCFSEFFEVLAANDKI